MVATITPANLLSHGTMMLVRFGRDDELFMPVRAYAKNGDVVKHVLRPTGDPQ